MAATPLPLPWGELLLLLLMLMLLPLRVLVLLLLLLLWKALCPWKGCWFSLVGTSLVLLLLLECGPLACEGAHGGSTERRGKSAHSPKSTRFRKLEGDRSLWEGLK